MAEDSFLWTTNNTGDGPSAGFTRDDLAQIFRMFAQTNSGGVFPNYLNELAVSGTSSPVAVNTGGALVYGYPYINTTSVNVTIPTPVTHPRIDRIVLRASWTAQTVRITRIAGTEAASPSAPAMTQSAGTTWDIPLATVQITTGGVITVTDAREMLLLVNELAIATGYLAASAVTTAKIADSNITTAKIADDAVTVDKIGAGAVDATALASNAVTTAKITDANVTTVKIADGNVTTAKIADANVTTVKIADANVTTAKIADLSVTTGKLADDAVTGAKIADNAIDPRAHISGTNGIVVDRQNGDARGTDAADLQTKRTANTQVASGNDSAIGGGASNTASGNTATVAGGAGNVASGTTSTVAGGTLNTAAGTSAAVPGGENNTASGDYATAMGYYASANKRGQVAHAAGAFAAAGDSQSSRFVLWGQTTNNAQTEIFTGFNVGRLTIASDTTWAFRALIVARRTNGDNESAAYEIVGCIDNNAGTTALVGTITKTVLAEDTAAWDVTAEADNTSDALVFKVTGENSKTINWVASVWTTEVTG